MADISQLFGQDLDVGPTGDLLPVEGTVRGQQRVLRRLLTNPGSYIFEPTYGAGLASYIGTAIDVRSLAGLIRAQLLLESAVAQTPAPTISVSTFAAGLVVTINYVDADTGNQVNLSFDVN